MAIQIDFDSTCGILRALISDKSDTDEYRDVMVQITSGDHYPAKVPTIWDLRKLDFADLDSQLGQYVKEIRSSFKKRGNAKIAYVVLDQLGYGLMRMFQVMTDTEEDSLVCYGYNEAEGWIRDVFTPLNPHD